MVLYLKISVCARMCVYMCMCVVIMYVSLLNTYYWADIVLYELCVSMCVFMFVCVAKYYLVIKAEI